MRKTEWIDYNQYISSEKWRAKRKLYLDGESSRRKCRICKSKEDLHVHHKTYENFSNENPEDLVTFCSYHHSECHKFYKKSNLTLWCATDKFIYENTKENKPTKKTLKKKKSKEHLKMVIQPKDAEIVWKFLYRVLIEHKEVPVNTKEKRVLQNFLNTLQKKF